MTSFLRKASLAFVFVTLFDSNVVWADEPSKAEREAAKKLYEEAATEVEQGQYQSACGKFAEALFLTPGHIRTAISLGSCMDKWGKTASAMKHYADARTWSRDQGKSDKISEIDTLIGKLAPRLSRLTITVPAEYAKLEGFAVRRGGETLSRDDWGEAKVIDPGKYDIEVMATGYPTWKTKLEVAIGQTIEITLNPGWREPKKGFGPGLGFMGLGVGGALLVTGGILGGVAIGKYNESTRSYLCNDQNQCIRAGYDLRLEAQQFGNVSTGFIIAGGVVAATGLTLVLLSKSSKNETTATVRPQITVHPGGMVFSGTW